MVFVSHRMLKKKKNANIAKTITTRAGSRMDDNFLIDIDSEQSTFTFDNTNAELRQAFSNKSELKAKLCNELLEKGLVEEGDVIRHSYTNNRLNNGVDNMNRTESKEKLSPTLDTRCDCLGVVVKDEDTLKREVCNQAIVKNLVQPYDIIDHSYSNSRLEELMKGFISTKNSENNQIANTITTGSPNFGVCVPELRIRKLTPKECWLLMGFDPSDVEKASKVCSNSQLYKQAGNSIVVDVLMAIFKELFVPKKTRSEWLDELLGGL